MSRALQQRGEAEAGFPRLLMEAEGELQKLLVRPEITQRFMRVALTEFRVRPELGKCSPGSIMASVLQAAQLGLEIGGPKRQGYLVPYKGECTFQPSYIGLKHLVEASGAFRIIVARLVHEKDEFRFHYDPRPVLFHKPMLWNAGAEIGVYVHACHANGEPDFLSMDRAEVEKVRSKSMNKNGEPWTQWWGEMAKKAVLKRFLKTQDLTPRLADAIALDDREYVTTTGEVVTRPALAAPPSRSAALARRLGVEVAESSASVEEVVTAEDYGGEVEPGREPGSDDE